MLTRQLASAGSGKTYALARQFIRLFITIPSGEDPSSGRRLRTRSELADSLRHILAVTFTNKATGEMKQRIISKLAALSAFSEGDDPGKTDYLTDFADELGVPPAEVARVAKEALDVLLNEFSDFQVSTIDSFFQQIMRTFTYEAELPDNFQLELDSGYVSALGLDSALVDLSSGRFTAAFRYWVRMLVESEVNLSGSWNLFSPGKRTLYNKVLRMLETMESESFKESMLSLRDYFNKIEGIGDPTTGGRLGEIFRLYDNKYILPLMDRGSRVRSAARRCLEYLVLNGIDPANLAQHLHSRIQKLSRLNWRTGPEGRFTAKNFELKSVMKASFGDDEGLHELVSNLGAEYDEFEKLFTSAETRTWMAYSKGFRQLALTWEIKKKIDSLMLDSGSLKLSDTNSILRTIIGDDVAPFIYERIGSRLDHYLIDEFQDTSRLQWENTLPLLRESESRGHENLIIGDPKQSIYRFRNADSSLITKAVFEAFPDLHDAGSDPTKNTNWRSALNIVRFNNFLFHSFAVLGMDYTDSYRNVIQYSKKNLENPLGFVRMRFYKKDSGVDSSFSYDGASEEEPDLRYPAFFKEIGPLISDLRKRGFPQREIAVLVLRHKVGAQVIESLLDYNAGLDPSDSDSPAPIRFVSEDSLKVANSQGVRIILEALQAIAGTAPFTRPRVSKSEGREAGGDTAENESLESSDGSESVSVKVKRPEPLKEYRTYADKSNPSMSADLSQLLRGMSVTTLPAIVEQIIADFVSPNIRHAEAPFLAAFQDTVLEFCETHLADAATFLRWWEKHGGSLAISSPENTDAVRVLTVHSAKGLEFGAVIIPDAGYNFEPSPYKTETAWVKPRLPLIEDASLPDFLPIEVKKELENTPHGDLVERNFKEVATDSLNALYVAFTRAKYELYTLCEIAKNSWPKEPESEEETTQRKNRKKRTGEVSEPSAALPVFKNAPAGFFRILDDAESLTAAAPADKMPYMLRPQELVKSRGELPAMGNVFVCECIEYKYGAPVNPAQIERDKNKNQEHPSESHPGHDAVTEEEDSIEDGACSRESVIKGYPVRDALPLLHFLEEGEMAPGAADSGVLSDDVSADEGEGETSLSKTVREETDSETGRDDDEGVEEEDTVPGSYESLVRETILGVVRGSSLDTALMSRFVTGRWTDSQIETARRQIGALLESPKGKEWFCPDAGWKLYACRPLIRKGRKTRTPDLLVISPKEERAIVVNIKTTPAPSEYEWRRLRCHIRAFRSTGFRGRIEGWLVHLPAGTFNPLEEE